MIATEIAIRTKIETLTATIRQDVQTANIFSPTAMAERAALAINFFA
jgi:hypothetical protein